MLLRHSEDHYRNFLRKFLRQSQIFRNHFSGLLRIHPDRQFHFYFQELLFRASIHAGNSLRSVARSPIDIFHTRASGPSRITLRRNLHQNKFISLILQGGHLQNCPHRSFFYRCRPEYLGHRIWSQRNFPHRLIRSGRQKAPFHSHLRAQSPLNSSCHRGNVRLHDHWGCLSRICPDMSHCVLQCQKLGLTLAGNELDFSCLEFDSNCLSFLGLHC